ncbi:hypothetical protein F11_12055 [Rhodospirillum rubrum F11]|nr:hypothetical protein F11_12055 [Rhodospirillum rubrum F11]
MALFAPPATAEDALVPASMVNAWIYCPRLAVLEWGRGEKARSVDLIAGLRAHQATESGPTPALPDPMVLREDQSLKTRKLSLSSERLGLTAELDLLDVEEGVVIPVEIKVGKRPSVDEGAYLPERAQVCAQALLLREAGYTCLEGALWFAESRERVTVDLTEALVTATLVATSDLRLTVASGRLPPPLDHSAKCPRCSLLPICLPDEIAWFRKGSIARTPPPPASPALPLYGQTPGARIGKKDRGGSVCLDRMAAWLSSRPVPCYAAIGMLNTASGASHPSVARHADGGASARSFRLPTAFRRPVRRSLPCYAAR